MTLEIDIRFDYCLGTRRTLSGGGQISDIEDALDQLAAAPLFTDGPPA